MINREDRHDKMARGAALSSSFLSMLVPKHEKGLLVALKSPQFY